MPTPLGVLALWWPLALRRNPSHYLRKGQGCPLAAAPSQGRLQALLDLPLPRPSSPSREAPVEAPDAPAQEESCPQVLGSQQPGGCFMPLSL